jgi:DNA-binding PadR family transcriptional regulator
MPGRLLWLYALATLEREGTVYGYALSDRIAERTEGAWRPGAGAIYPALQSLVHRGAARAAKQGRRRVYSITPFGRTLLRRIRSQMAAPGPGAPDLSLLWAEIAGAPDPGAHLLRRLHRHLESLDAFLARQPEARSGSGTVRAAAIDELSTALKRLRSGATSASGSRRRQTQGVRK